jgi:hypothetical protein
MNILFILGNGFDINLGMATRYSDFYKYYISQSSKSDIIAQLKNSITANLKNWSDLELALGEYTENISSLNDFDEIFDDIGDNLSEYLQHQEDSFDYDKIDLKKVFSHLSNPESFLLKADEESVKEFRDNWSNYQWNTSIFTFNYTCIIEKLLGDGQLNLLIGTHKQAPIILNKIEHIHGYLNNRMIIGVNDISQVKNVEFHTKQDILEAIIKSKCNQVQKHNIDKLFKSEILSSNLICIFGSSIGDTDKIWWELVGEQLTKNCYLIIFDRCDDIPLRIIYKKGRREREVKDYFLSKTNLDENEKEVVKSKIFIAINSEMFKGIHKD